MKKTGLFGVIQKPSERMYSHNAGHTLMLISQLKFNGVKCEVVSGYDLSDFETIVITEGVNFREGVYNVFGGVSDELLKRLEALENFGGEIVCFDRYIPDYSEFCIKRKLDFKFTKKIKRGYTLGDKTKMILGDSHSLSVFKPDYILNRNDGKTLHGALKVGLKNYINPETRDLICYFGNIDNKFHLCRQKDPFLANELLVNEYINQLSDLNLDMISVVEILPIENPSRKIPSTGKYKGQNYFGEPSLRNELRLLFNKKIADSGVNVLKWDLPLDNNGYLSFDAQESKQSVHLRPSFYMFIDEILK